MNLLSTLATTVSKGAKRRGRGYGSGRGGHTSGRGGKGDKARGKVKLTEDGSKIKKSWIQRLPKLRGKTKNKTVQNKITVSLSQLSKWFKKGQVVSTDSLNKKLGQFANYKVVATGKLTHALTIKGLKVSAVAVSQVEAAGGKIEA